MKFNECFDFFHKHSKIRKARKPHAVAREVKETVSFLLYKGILKTKQGKGDLHECILKFTITASAFSICNSTKGSTHHLKMFLYADSVSFI